jgi:hypothetical protein
MDYVTDVMVKARGDSNWVDSSPGNGWEVVKNIRGEAMEFGKGHGGRHTYIFYKRGSTAPPISALMMVKGRDAQPLEGWDRITTYFNMGADGEYIYLCYRRSAGGAHISTLKAGYGDAVNGAMEDFKPGDIVIFQDTSEGSGGKYCFLGWAFGD